MTNANWFEQLIERVSPERAARRAYFRNVLALSGNSSVRAYDAAKIGRRTEGWIAPGSSANAEITRSLPLIRQRARELVRNNPFASVAVRKLASKTVGTGITPRLKVGAVDDPRRGQARDIWNRFSDNCDPEGQHDFYGLQNILARTMYESGEALIRLLPRPSSWNLPIPLQFEVLEGDYLDSFRNFEAANGDLVIQGVQFDTTGRRVGYWLFDHHPGDIFAFTRRTLASNFVPAENIRHVFESLRPGQARGVPIFTPVALKLRDVEDYDDAELMRQKVAACFAAFVTKPAGTAMTPLANPAATKTNDAGQRQERMAPGIIQYLNMGEEVSFGNPPSPNGYTAYMAAQLHTVAAGCGITYEMLTGDLSSTNFSSIRAGMNDFYDLRDAWRWLTLIPQAHNPIWDRVGQLAAMLGQRKAKDPWTAKWTPPATRFVNPKEDIDAIREGMRIGVKPYFEAVAELGEDGEEMILEIAAFNELVDKHEIILDGDPRKVGRVSAAAAPSPGANPEAPPPDANTGKKSAQEENVMTRSMPATAEERRGTPPPARGNRLMSFVASTYDASAHTVDVTVSTGAAVKRWFGTETLAMTPDAIDLSRVTLGQVKVLDSHNAYEIGAILGTLVSARIEAGQLIGTVKFDTTDAAVAAEGQVARGVLTGISCGYQVNLWRLVTMDDTGNETWIADRWTLYEVSFVSVPADPTAGVRSVAVSPGNTPPGGTNEDPEMQLRNAPGAAAATTIVPPATTTATAVPAASNDDAVRAAREEGARIERTRQAEIRTRTDAVRLPPEIAQTLIDEAVPLDRVAQRLTDEIAKRAPAAAPGRIAIERDETQTRVEAIEESILHRAFPASVKLDKGREWRGMRLMDIGRDILVAKGEKVRGISQLELAQRALTTSDLSNVLANVANKSLQMGYTQEKRTFLPFCTQHDPVDFKQVSSIVLSEGSNLEVVDEHGEFRRGSLSDSAEKWNLTAYGKIIGFTRQAMINDDLSALTRVPQQFGIAGVRLENDQVWSIFTTNAALSDSVALFHATHKNLQSGGGSVLQVSSLGTARKDMRIQKGPDGNQILNLVLRYLIVPAVLETTLEQIMSPLLFASQTSNTVPEFYRALTPIVEPRLDANSTTAWYGACDPGQYATIEYGYLQGQDGVYLETKIGFEVDGMQIKVRHDFGCKAVNFRGLYKSAGA